MGNINKKELPRNPSKECIIPFQSFLNDSNPLMKNKKQLRSKDDKRNTFSQIETVLSSLRSLTWNFALCELSDKEIEEFSLILKKNKVLTYLDLNFTDCKKFTNKALICLSSAFGGLHALPVLRITSLESGKFNIKGLETFFLSLKHCQALRELKLSFRNGININNETVTFLSQALKGLSSLSALDLGFFECSNITDNVVEILSLGLRSLRTLRELILIFDNSWALTNQGIEKFGHFLKEMKSLFYFNLTHDLHQGGYWSFKTITLNSEYNGF